MSADFSLLKVHINNFSWVKENSTLTSTPTMLFGEVGTDFFCQWQNVWYLKFGDRLVTPIQENFIH